ncbi:MAG: uroporphyrinogen decarboxylase [Acetobacteraceae bacterium]
MAGLKMLRTLDGEAVWPPPVWLMRQAGRYLPEYWVTRAKAGDFITLATTPELATEVTLQPLRRFGFDAAILFSDILILSWALGHGLEYQQGEGPILPKLHDAAGVAALDLARLSGAIAPVLETVRRVRAGIAAEGHDAALIGFAGAPFTVACYMVEGGGSKDFAVTRRMAHAEPALFDALMERLTDATIIYLSAQAEAGAECLMLFDSWAGVLPPTLFARHVIAPTRRIVRTLRARGIRLIGFPRLAGAMLGVYAAETGVDAVGMDTATDPAWARGAVLANVALQGNLDPMALLAGGEALRSEASAILAAMRGRPFVFNLGHGIVPETPPEHVAALVELIRAG